MLLYLFLSQFRFNFIHNIDDDDYGDDVDDGEDGDNGDNDDDDGDYDELLLEILVYTVYSRIYYMIGDFEYNESSACLC